MFEALADDMVDFAKAVATDFLQLLDTLLGQITSWLAQPVDIPFVAGLYQALTGDQLSLLDLICLIAAVPATILLDVITGSPTVPDTVAAGTGAATAADPGDVGAPGSAAGQILLGVASAVISIAGEVMDSGLLAYMDSWSSLGPAKSRGGKSLFVFLNYLDFAVDFIGWGLGVAVSSGWLVWKWPDWFYWVVQSVPQGFNFGYLFRSDSTNENQVKRDTIFGVVMLLLSAVYAAEWPAGYRDAPKAPGLVLSANIFSSVSGICEAPLLAGNPWLVLEFVLPVKLTAATVSILGFTAYVLGVED